MSDPLSPRDQGCTRKKAYRSRREARRAVKRSARAWHEQRSDLTVYRCDFCDGWHLGHRRRT